jgi:hypothetical protein
VFSHFQILFSIPSLFLHCVDFVTSIACVDPGRIETQNRFRSKYTSPARLKETSPITLAVGLVVFVVNTLVYLLPLFLKSCLAPETSRASEMNITISIDRF